MQNKMVTITYFLWALCILVIAIAIFLFTVSIIGMLIDHECYQLQPNNNYVHSVCERYWK